MAGKYLDLPESALGDRSLSRDELAVLAVYWSYANRRSFEAWPAESTIAADLGDVSPRWVRTVRGRLTQKGYLHQPTVYDPRRGKHKPARRKRCVLVQVVPDDGRAPHSGTARSGEVGDGRDRPRDTGSSRRDTPTTPERRDPVISGTQRSAPEPDREPSPPFDPPSQRNSRAGEGSASRPDGRDNPGLQGEAASAPDGADSSGSCSAGKHQPDGAASRSTRQARTCAVCGDRASGTRRDKAGTPHPVCGKDPCARTIMFSKGGDHG